MGPARPQPFGRMGVAGDLFVSRRRRCHCIASSSLRNLASQAPSANVTVFMKGSTKALLLGGLDILLGGLTA